MGMFDTVFVKAHLPLTDELKALNIKWDEVDFQTKDLYNLLDTYEITKEGKLRHLWQERVWKDSDDSLFGGYLDVVKEEWRDVDFHGTIGFYTSHTDNDKYRWDFMGGADQISWDDIDIIVGNDWWMEFEASFTKGNLDGFKVIKVEKTPIKDRIKNNKEWAEKRAIEDRKIHNQIIGFFRQFKMYREVIRQLIKLTNNVHGVVTKVLYKL